MYVGHLIYEGNYVAEELHQATYTHVLACTDAEDGEHTAGSQSLADTFAHLVLGERLLFEELLHQAFIVLSSSLHQGLVPLGGLLHLFGRHLFDGGCTAIRSPRVFLHQQHVNQRVEVGACSQRVLHGYDLGAIDGLELVEHHIVVTLFVIQLVDKENHRLAQFLGIAEVVLGTYLRTILTIEEQDGCISYIECSDGSTYEVVTTRAVDDVELLTVPLHMIDGRKYRVAILLFYGEVVAHCILGRDSSATFYNTTLIEQGLCESGFT